MMVDTAFQTRVAAAQQPNWCSFAEETTFLNAVVAASARVSVQSHGNSPGGLAIRSVTISHPVPTTENKRLLVIFGGQHGVEGAGREAALQWINTLATSDNEDITEYLTHVCVIVFPNCNPDNQRIWQDGQQNLASGLNPNRDHHRLTSAEIRPTWTHLAGKTPDLVLDLHEAGGRSAQGIEFAPFGVPEVNADLAAENQALTDRLITKMQAEGFTSTEYVSPFAWSTRFGTACTAAALTRHSICQLFESRIWTSGTPDNTFPRVTRVNMQMIALREVLDYHAENFSRIDAITAAARHEDIVAGYRFSDFQLTESMTINPAGYRLTSAQMTTSAAVITAHGFVSYASGSDRVFPMGQPSGQLLPPLFDASAFDKLVSAVRLTSLPLPPVRAGGQLKAAAVNKGVVTMKIGIGL